MSRQRFSTLLLCFCGLTLQHSIAVGGDPQLAINPVYRQLIEVGIEADGEAHRLPLPALTETADAAAQKAVIEKVVHESLRERFFRKSVVAPHVVKLESKDRADGSRLRMVHFWFAANANLNDVAESDFLNTMSTQRRDEDSDKGRVLTDEELKERGIALDHSDPDNPNENYGHGAMRLLKKVDITATSRSYWTQNEDSAVAAVVLDPRFANDETFPNSWRTLTRDEAGTLLQGEPHPYAGSGGYVKITQLAEPQGFVLVEGHMAFVEPHAWFRGANLLGSKLPALIQTEVRRVRRLLLKAAATQD